MGRGGEGEGEGREGKEGKGNGREEEEGRGGGKDVICSLRIDCHSWLRQLSSYTYSTVTSSVVSPK